MKIRQLTAADLPGAPWKAKIARGLCAVSVEPGEMPELAPWFPYMIGTFDRKRIHPSDTPTGARRGYKKAARALLLKAQAGHAWPVPLTKQQIREAKARDVAATPRRQNESESAAEAAARVRERMRAEELAGGPALVRRFNLDATHPLTYTHRSGAVAWVRRTKINGVPGFRMMIADALGMTAHGIGPTIITDLSDAANQLDALVANRFGSNWTPEP